jgi:hypothetical protein
VQNALGDFFLSSASAGLFSSSPFVTRYSFFSTEIYLLYFKEMVHIDFFPDFHVQTNSALRSTSSVLIRSQPAHMPALPSSYVPASEHSMSLSAIREGGLKGLAYVGRGRIIRELHLQMAKGGIGAPAIGRALLSFFLFRFLLEKLFTHYQQLLYTNVYLGC